MTAKEILRYCETMGSLRIEEHRREIRLFYMGAALQRSKKLPKLNTLTGEPPKGVSLKELRARLEAAPTFEVKE